MKKKMNTPFWIHGNGLKIGRFPTANYVKFNDPKLTKFWFRKLTSAYEYGRIDGLNKIKHILRKQYPELFDL